MKLGVIARADDRGLGHQTWEVARNMAPERVLVLTVPSSEGQGFEPHLDRFPDATHLIVDDRVSTWRLNERAVREWLDGLDVVYTAETFYDDRLPVWAHAQGVATVCHVNPEWYRHHRGGIPHPTQWWSATDWRLNMLPDDTRVVPMPVPLDRFDYEPSDDRAVIHPAGRVAAGDRNGTDIVCAMAAELPDVRVLVSAQAGLRRLPRNVERLEASTDYWDTYRHAPVMVLPRRYGGLCLPVIEACGAGVVPVLPDCKPNQMWPAVHVKSAKSRQKMKSQGGTLAMFDTDPRQLAEAVAGTLDDLEPHRARVRAWARDHSWDARAGDWTAELERVADKAPAPRKTQAPTLKPSAKVSVLVPFTEERAGLWAWLKRRWEHQHPDWEIVDVECVGQWSKGSTIYQAAQWAHADVFVIADADSYTDPDTMRASVEALDDHAWVVPHKDVYRMSQRTTERWLRQDPWGEFDHRNAAPERAPYKGAHGGGMVVLRRETLADVPMDPRFVGYGGEDLSWGEALETLAGPFHRVGGDLVHLWHPPLDGRRKSAETVWLRRQYQLAKGSPRLMRALLDGVEPGEATPLPKPARFTCENQRIRLKVLGQSIQFREGYYETTDPDLADALRRHPRVEEVA